MNTKLKGLKAQESLYLATLKFDNRDASKLKDVQKRIKEHEVTNGPQEEVWGHPDDQEYDRWKDSQL